MLRNARVNVVSFIMSLPHFTNSHQTSGWLGLPDCPCIQSSTSCAGHKLHSTIDRANSCVQTYQINSNAISEISAEIHPLPISFSSVSISRMKDSPLYSMRLPEGSEYTSRFPAKLLPTLLCTQPEKYPARPGLILFH